MKKETLNKEETKAVKELIERIPDEELEKAAGGLKPRTKQILRGIGVAALVAGATWFAVDQLSGFDNSGKQEDNVTKKPKSTTATTSEPHVNENTKNEDVPSNHSGFDWEAYNNDNTKFDDPNFGVPSAPPIPEDELWKYGY